MIIKYIKIIAILIFYIFSPITFAQELQTMLNKENLKGKVKSVYITTGNGKTLKVWFDITGHITKKETKWSKNEDILISSDYQYDNEDRLISYNVYRKNNPTSKVEVIYKYDKNGMLELHNRTLKYDDRGNCIFETTQAGHGNVYTERIYNEKNQIVEAFSHKGPVRLNIWRTDGNGNRAYEETKWTEPEKTSHVFFEYNDHGDISLITLKTENGYTILNKKGVITYGLYDSVGNWLEQTHPIDSDGNNQTHSSYNKYFEIYETHLSGFNIKRTIEYYE